MPQQIPECSEENRLRREIPRAEMHRLTMLNGPEKVIAATQVTKGLPDNNIGL